ncbi:glutathione S-transferase C-terminal-like protein [Ganoderma leucocontextum]|nr:glutathione S-transferase C-terminal-like protein [Ganoderma leucocontextum]
MSSTRPEKKQRTEDYVLYYWPGVPGRGEYVRLALEYGGIRYTEQNSPGPGGLIPLLSDASRIGHPTHFAPPALQLPSGRVVSQTGAILHIIAPRCGLAGASGSKLNVLTAEGRAALKELSEDELERGEEERAAVSQLVLSALDWQTEAHNVHHPIAIALYYDEQKPEAARAGELFRRDRIPRWLGHFENVLKTNPATASASADGARVYLVGKQTTAADLVLFHVIDGISFAFPTRMAQLREGGEYANVFALYEQVKGEKGIKQYLASGRRQKFNGGIFRHYAELDQEESK